MPLAGMGPWEGSFGEEGKSFVDMGHVKFVGSHLEISGIVVEVGGSDKPAPQIYASLWKPQQCPTYPGPQRKSQPHSSWSHYIWTGILLRTGVSLPFFLREGSWSQGPKGSLTL